MRPLAKSMWLHPPLSPMRPHFGVTATVTATGLWPSPPPGLIHAFTGINSRPYSSSIHAHNSMRMAICRWVPRPQGRSADGPTNGREADHAGTRTRGFRKNSPWSHNKAEPAGPSPPSCHSAAHCALLSKRASARSPNPPSAPLHPCTPAPVHQNRVRGRQPTSSTPLLTICEPHGPPVDPHARLRPSGPSKCLNATRDLGVPRID